LELLILPALSDGKQGAAANMTGYFPEIHSKIAGIG